MLTPEFYLEMEAILKGKGLERGECETASEFAKRAKSSDVVLVTTAFESVRYGGAKLTETDIENIQNRLEGLREMDKAA